MAILAKCAECKRENGYAEKAEDKICARCKKLVKSKKKENG